LAQTSILS